MPILRNPFRKTPGDHVNDESFRPSAYTVTGLSQKKTDQDTTGVKPQSIDLSGAQQQPTEYKLSEISDSGVYLPPSPGEKKSFWSPRSSGSARSSTHRIALNENEPFNISRESFDSYRRSFDISARSPVTESAPSNRPRQSLDVRHMRYPSTQSFSTQASFTSMRSQSLSQHPSQRSVQTLSSVYTAEPSESPLAMSSTDQSNVEPATIEDNRFEPAFAQTRRSMAVERPPTIPEPESDRFDDVALHDPKPKRHGLFSRFGVGSSATETADGTNRPNSSGGHGFFGRKRGTSGQGAELGAMGIRRPTSRGGVAGNGTPQIPASTQAQAPVQSLPQTQAQPQPQTQMPATTQTAHQPYAQIPAQPGPQLAQLQQMTQTTQPLLQTQQVPTQKQLQPQPQPQMQSSLQIGPQVAASIAPSSTSASTSTSTPEPPAKAEIKAE